MKKMAPQHAIDLVSFTLSVVSIGIKFIFHIKTILSCKLLKIVTLIHFPNA